VEGSPELVHKLVTLRNLAVYMNPDDRGIKYNSIEEFDKIMAEMIPKGDPSETTKTGENFEENLEEENPSILNKNVQGLRDKEKEAHDKYASIEYTSNHHHFLLQPICGSLKAVTKPFI